MPSPRLSPEPSELPPSYTATEPPHVDAAIARRSMYPDLESTSVANGYEVPLFRRPRPVYAGLGKAATKVTTEVVVSNQNTPNPNNGPASEESPNESPKEQNNVNIDSPQQKTMPEVLQRDPSLTAGDTVVDSQEKLHVAIREVVPMLGLDEESAAQALSAYVDSRVDALSLADDGHSLGNDRRGTKTFIASSTKMELTSFVNRPYHMDDSAAYKSAIPFVQDTFNTYRAEEPHIPEDKAYLNAVINGANLGQVQYFGSYYGDEAHRNTIAADVVLDDNTPRPPDLSIADFKGSAALCQERAGVAHNTLQVFGVSSKFEAGSLDTIHADGTITNEPHAFITMENTDGDGYIFDPTYALTVEDEQDNIIGIRPALYKIDPAAGKEQHVQRQTYKLVEGEMQPDQTEELVYHLGK